MEHVRLSSPLGHRWSRDGRCSLRRSATRRPTRSVDSRARAASDAAFPEACADDAEVEALYRFLRNRRVSLLYAGRAPRGGDPCPLCRAGKVLVIHDTTDVVFAGEIAHRPVAVGKGRQGIQAAYRAVAVRRRSARAAGGVVAPAVRSPRARAWHGETCPRPVSGSRQRESLLGDGVAAVRTRFGDPRTTIHVMDRAGDSYESSRRCCSTAIGSWCGSIMIVAC